MEFSALCGKGALIQRANRQLNQIGRLTVVDVGKNCEMPLVELLPVVQLWYAIVTLLAPGA